MIRLIFFYTNEFCRMWKALLIIFISVVFIISCNNSKQTQTQTVSELDNSIEIANGEDYIFPIINSDTCLVFVFNNEYKCKVEFVLPKDSIKASILLLHGWNLPGNQWCDSTDFCDKAKEENYALIIPDLGKCNYPLEIYPETLEQYKKYPSLTWIMDSLLNGISEQSGLLKEGHKNFVAGISTGGRGATLLAFYMPYLFDACATLSGDFDITAMQNEFLYIAWFGQFAEFKDRWENECFAYRCNDYIVPSYIGHGKKDNVSPVLQSMAMYDSLKYHHPDLLIIENFPDESKHDYTYWTSETDNIIEFFNRF